MPMQELSISTRTTLLRLSRFGIDILISGLAFYLSYLIVAAARDIDIYAFSGVPEKTFAFAAVGAVALVICRVDKGSWRHVSIPDLIVLVKAAALSVIAYLFVAFLMSRGENVPRTVLILTFIFMVIGLSAVRLAYRLAIEGSWLDFLGIRPLRGKKKALVYGFTDQAEGYIRSIRRRNDSDTYVVGILDDDKQNKRRSIQGVSVIGRLLDLERVLEHSRNMRWSIDELVVADPKLSRQKLNELVELAVERGLKVSRIPDVSEPAAIDNGASFQPKPIELSDLMDRAEVETDIASVARMVQGKVVLATGAGGSIGSELCRQIAALEPRRLIITDSSEFHLYLLDNELRGRFPHLDIVTNLVSVRDEVRVKSVFNEHKPQVVFHAAALKHVPMVEENPVEGVKTNVLGTRNVADAAIEVGTSTFVVISTDKAVNPTNIMGATKRAAEAYCQSLDIRSSTTRFKTVRFGNVLGSNGSVVPLFESQIAKGGPLTVTHPNIVRFFMTIPEAVRLVLHASAHKAAGNGNRGKIMVLDMGKPVRIADLAARMIKLAGFKPGDIEIVYTGLRPGEKLYEELFDPSEVQDEKTDDGYFIASPRVIDAGLLQRTLDGLVTSTQREDALRTTELLKHLVPEYVPSNPSEIALAGSGHNAEVAATNTRAEDDWR